MKAKKRILVGVFVPLFVLSIGLYFSISKVFAVTMKVYKGDHNFTWNQPPYNPSKKTVFVIADNEGTEMLDLMAPYFLFNATESANVYVVSEKKVPILLVNSLFILPHYTFSEMDSLKIKADVIVIPNMTIHLKSPPKTSTVSWIKKQYTGDNIILSICDGSATAAATGLYDGKQLTTHASDFKILKKQFPKPVWVKDINVTQSGNLYSTAGVSNAVEGSLTVIKNLFGEEILQKVILKAKYPHVAIQRNHSSEVVNTSAIINAVSRFIFQKRDKIGVLLQQNVNEFELASILDTYSRTLPKSIHTFSVDNRPVISKYGLTLYPSGILNDFQPDEIHLLTPETVTLPEKALFKNAGIVNYYQEKKQYGIDICLDRIDSVFGRKFKNFVMLTLDYN